MYERGKANEKMKKNVVWGCMSVGGGRRVICGCRAVSDCYRFEFRFNLVFFRLQKRHASNQAAAALESHAQNINKRVTCWRSTQGRDALHCRPTLNLTQKATSGWRKYFPVPAAYAQHPPHLFSKNATSLPYKLLALEA